MAMLTPQSFGEGADDGQPDRLAELLLRWSVRLRDRTRRVASAQAHVPGISFRIVRSPDLSSTQAACRNRTLKQAWRGLREARSHHRGFEGWLDCRRGEHAFGGAGEMFQEFLDANQTSAPTCPSPRKVRNVWQNYWEDVITFGMMDPESKTPLTATLEGQPIDDNLADRHPGIVAFIQPDHSGVRCHRADRR